MGLDGQVAVVTGASSGIGRAVARALVAPGGVNTEFAIGTGRVAGDPGLDLMLGADDVAGAVVFALSQSESTRIFLIGMRPASEPL